MQASEGRGKQSIFRQIDNKQHLSQIIRGHHDETAPSRDIRVDDENKVSKSKYIVLRSTKHFTQILSVSSVERREGTETHRLVRH